MKYSIRKKLILKTQLVNSTFEFFTLQKATEDKNAGLWYFNNVMRIKSKYHLNFCVVFLKAQILRLYDAYCFWYRKPGCMTLKIV